MMVYRIKGWHKFQHFKDRKPPWVKLYRDVLDDMDWHELDPVAAKALVMMWLIASEDDGRLPDEKKLAFRLRVSENSMKSIISKLHHWLEQDDINAISDGHQDDGLETETEEERDTEKETKTKRALRLSSDFRLPKEWVDWTFENHPKVNAQQTFDQFKDYWIAKAGPNASKLDWFSTWRNWVRRSEEKKPSGFQPVNKQAALEERNRAVMAEFLAQDEPPQEEFV